MQIAICVGSSCHLKGSHQLVERFQKEITARKLDTEITPFRLFLYRKVQPRRVTIVIDGVTHTGVTPENFDGFLKRMSFWRFKMKKRR